MEGVTARDVMSREFVGVSEADHVDEVLELMVEEEVDDVLVLRGSEPVGVVSSHDVLAAVKEDGIESTTVEDVMRGPPDPVQADSDVGTVLSELSAVGVDQLPVSNGDDDLVGVVTDGDVITAATSMLAEPRSDAAATEGVEPVAGSQARTSPGGGGETARERAQEEYTQGVCESCGTLTGDLQVHNGQSICPECRDV